MAKVAPIINQEKANRFSRMFPPRIKQMAKQIKLIENCSNKHNYEFAYTDTVALFFIVIFKELTLVARKFDLVVDETETYSITPKFFKKVLNFCLFLGVSISRLISSNWFFFI